MTAKYIAFHAAERPDAVAVIYGGREISYGRFHRDIASVTSAAREFGVARGRAVAIGCDDYYFHWLLLLAFERLGAATASLGANETDAPLLAHVDLVLSESDLPPASAPRQHRITPAWIERVLERTPVDEPQDAPRHPEDIVRIERTSGTTGAFKCLPNSRRVFDGAIENWIWRCGPTRECRYLMTMPFTVAGPYHHATACLHAGGTVVMENRVADVGAELVRRRITQVTFLPIQLKAVLDRLPADFVKPPNLTVSTLGATVMPALRAQATARLATRLYETYGCNEVGFVCSIGISDEGRGSIVFPGASVEIVDEADRRVPAGRPGWIRIRTGTMVDGYLGDPVTTQRMFRGGWFYPGDLGIAPEPGRLIVLGREDELLNIGGKKIRPENVENSISTHASVADVGVCTLRDPQGVEQLWIALVGATVEDDTLLKQIKYALRDFNAGGFLAVKLASIPRTATGKIQRNLLKERLAAHRRDAQG